MQIARSPLYCRFEHRPAGRKVGTSCSEVRMDTHTEDARVIWVMDSVKGLRNRVYIGKSGYRPIGQMTRISRQFYDSFMV